MNNAYIWRATQERLRQKTTSAQFETWLRGTQLLSLANGHAVLGAPTTFAREQLDTRFRALIESALGEVAGVRCALAIEVLGSQTSQPPQENAGEPANGADRLGLFDADVNPAPDGAPGQPTGRERIEKRGQRSAITTPLHRRRGFAPLPHSPAIPTQPATPFSPQEASGGVRGRNGTEGGGRGATGSGADSIGTGGVSAVWGAGIADGSARAPASDISAMRRPAEGVAGMGSYNGRRNHYEPRSAHDGAAPVDRTQAFGASPRYAPDDTLADDFEDDDDSAPTNEPANGYQSGYTSGAPASAYSPYGIAAPRLNTRYTFSTFIVGSGNRMAHAASQAVAEAPGYAYNPLFLYGGVGLGKTHLLHAVGHTALEHNLVVLYVSSETFTNEIVNAILHRTTEEFRAKYRSVDVLLVDDIQFIAGKDSTEEEFFHTFNSLHEANKQIVICSDRPPKAIVSLEDRLRSRFEWGLIADIQPPDLETRIAILRAKTALTNRHVPDDVILYLASHVQSNIRELEGSLNRLIAYATLQGMSLSVETSKAALASLASDGRQRRVSVGDILDAVADHYHIPLEDLRGKQRDKHIVTPRQVAMYLMRQETDASLLEIGQALGGRDHSTVLHGCEKIGNAINENTTLRKEVLAIRQRLLE